MPSRRRRHHPVALALVHAAVQRLGAVAAPVHRLGELVDLGARPAEHERRLRRLDVEDASERVRLVGPLHPVDGLADEGLVARLGLAAADLDLHRIALVALGDGVDAVRHRGREQHRLAVVRRALEDRLDVVGEAHVEHLVGLVEDHRADRVELERAAPDVVDGAARGRHDDVDATVEQLQLALDRLAAEHRDHLDAEFLAVLEHRLAHLHGEFAGRHQDEHRRLGRAGSCRCAAGPGRANAAVLPVPVAA